MSTKQIPRSVERFIIEHRLIEKPGPLVVGVSGGVDSVCLLHVLITLRDHLGLNLHVSHLNHQLRGEESDDDAEYVRRLADDLNVASTIESRNVKEYQVTHQCSLEEAAREVRYMFFSEVAESLGGDTVVVAHTANDQAETILMHLIRGSGLAGLRGMRSLTQWNLPNGKRLTIVRPLLEISRSETERYCADHKLMPRQDSSNRSSEFLRSRIRSEIMPKLLGYNPNLVDGLSRMARIVADDIAYLDSEAARLAETIVEEIPEGILLDNKAFCALPVAIRRQLLRASIRKILGGLRDIELVHIESILRVMANPAGKQLSLRHDLVFYGNYTKSAITRGDYPFAFLPQLEEAKVLKVPGKTVVSGWNILTRVIEGERKAGSDDQLSAYLDYDVVGNKLTVRKRRNGDRFQPLGMKHEKKLQDFMVDSKIPRSWRDDVPLICNENQIVWVVGWRIDQRARVTESTQRTLLIEFEMQ